jgi:hypothetical protein
MTGLLRLLGVVLIVSGSVSSAVAQMPGVLVDESLSKKSTAAVEIVGGEFRAEGWLAVKDTDYLRYELPKDALAATVAFEVKGIRLGAAGDARKHPFAVADRYLGPSKYYNATNSTTIMLRVWAKERDGSQPGKTRLRSVGLAYGQPDTVGSKFQADSPPLAWDAERWYKFSIRWTQTSAVFERDGEEISQLKFPDKQVPFQQVFINMAYYGIDMHGYNGATYRNLKITTP